MAWFMTHHKRRQLLLLGGLVAAAFCAGYLLHRAPESPEHVVRTRLLQTSKGKASFSPQRLRRSASHSSATDEGAPGGEMLPHSREIRFHPRAPEEWQGMPVDVAVRPPCEKSSLCQLALACVAGTCGPCSESSDCATGEVCVLDHCLERGRAECTRARDCPSGELCALVSEGSDSRRDVRGNLFLRSTCTSDGTLPGRDQNYDEEPEIYVAEDPPPLPPGSWVTGPQELQDAFPTTAVADDEPSDR
jgi:hypothetical protein